MCWADPGGGHDSPRLAREASSLPVRMGSMALCVWLTRPSMPLASDETHGCQLTDDYPLASVQATGADLCYAWCTGSHQLSHPLIPRTHHDPILSWLPGIHSGLYMGMERSQSLAWYHQASHSAPKFCAAWSRKRNCFSLCPVTRSWPPRQGLASSVPSCDSHLQQ